MAGCNLPSDKQVRITWDPIQRHHVRSGYQQKKVANNVRSILMLTRRLMRDPCTSEMESLALATSGRTSISQGLNCPATVDDWTLRTRPCCTDSGSVEEA